MKAAAYLRISTDDDRQHLDLQREPLLKEIESRGWTLYKVYEDQASGSGARRHGLDALMEEARQKRFGVVVVWKFDRFARSVKHLVEALEFFRGHGIEFRSLTEGIDTSTYVGKMVYTIMAAIAEFERDLLRERIKAGMAAARARGVEFKGRKPLDIDMARARGLLAQGWSKTKIAATLGVKRPTLLRRLRVSDGGSPGQGQRTPRKRSAHGVSKGRRR